MPHLMHKLPSKYYDVQPSSIYFKTSFINCVQKAMESRGWLQTEGNQWQLQWCQKQRINDVFDEGISGTQFVNHFRLNNQLCRKDLLVKNIRKHKKILHKQEILIEEEWKFFPTTYFLPSEYYMLVQEFKKGQALWIMKPTSRCQGLGIFLIDKLSKISSTYSHKGNTNQLMKPTIEKEQKQIKENCEENQEQQIKEQQINVNETYIVQRYIQNPLLFGLKKFDLRIYVLCTNYSALTVWLYRSGFARFTHQPYNNQNILNLESHLTNVSIQKQSQNYDPIRGGKWLLNKFKHYLTSRYGRLRIDRCFTEIKNVIIRSLEAVKASIVASKNSFELYGYDFMIDQELKCWLIEVNGGPSMTANTEFDSELKCGLIDDVLTVIDLQGIRSGQEMMVGGFDLIMDKNIQVKGSNDSEYHCLLGAVNDRLKIMQSIIEMRIIKQRKIGQLVQTNSNKNKTTVKKKEKALPNFYYKRNKYQTNNEIKDQLKDQLKFLSFDKQKFRPLNHRLRCQN